MHKETHKTEWREIEIEIRFVSEYFRGMAHIEVRSTRPVRAPLPISETGYRSHFMPMDKPENFDVVAWVIEELDRAAQSKGWQRQEDNNRQGKLCL